jgi:small subunit ribosomal protein S20
VAKIKSAKKRIKVNKRNQIQNRIYKSLVKTFTKKYFALIEEYKINPSEEKIKKIREASNYVYSKIDKAVKKNILHKNTAARKKSQIGLALKEF